MSQVEGDAPTDLGVLSGRLEPSEARKIGFRTEGSTIVVHRLPDHPEPRPDLDRGSPVGDSVAVRGENPWLSSGLVAACGAIAMAVDRRISAPRSLASNSVAVASPFGMHA